MHVMCMYIYNAVDKCHVTTRVYINGNTYAVMLVSLCCAPYLHVSEFIDILGQMIGMLAVTSVQEPIILQQQVDVMEDETVGKLASLQKTDVHG